MKRCILSILFVLLMVCVNSSYAAQPYVSDSNTVFLWSFDEVPGSTGRALINDYSWNRHNSTISPFGPAAAPRRTEGKWGNAYSGDDGYQQFGNVQATPLISESFTIEAWIKRGTGGSPTYNGWQAGLQNIVCTRETTTEAIPGNYYTFHLGLVNGTVSFGFTAEGGTNPQRALAYDGGLTLLPDTDDWVHIAGVYNPSAAQKATIYVNGVEVGTNQGLTGVPSSNTTNYLHMNIAYDPAIWGAYTNFTGSVDEVRLSDVARTAGELSPNLPDQLPKGLPYVEDSSTVFLWNMDEDAMTPILDSTSNNHDSTSTPNPTRVVGKWGNAYIGADGLRQFGNAQTTPLISGDFTVEAWIKRSADSGIAANNGWQADSQTIVCTRETVNDSKNQFTFFLGLLNGTVEFGFTAQGGIQLQRAMAHDGAQLRLPDTEGWIHIAGVYDPNATQKATIYINGAAVPTNQGLAGVPTGDTTNYLYLGGTLYNNTNTGGWGTYTDFMGSVDEVRLSDTARTPAELSPNLIPATCEEKLLVGIYTEGDIGGPGGQLDCTVDLYDLAILATNWLVSY